MEVNTINVLALAVRYSPPTLLIHYCSPADSCIRLVHQVKVYIKSNATAAHIADELARKEEPFLKETNVARDKLEFLIQMLIENKKIAPLVFVTPTYTKPIQNSFEPSGEKAEEDEAEPLGSKRRFEPESTLGSMPRGSSREDTKSRRRNSSSQNLPNSQDDPSDPQGAEETNSNSNDEEEDTDVIIAETVDGETIRLRKVVLEDVNREVLLDEEGNLYDLEGRFLGELEGDQPLLLPEFQKRVVEGRGKGTREVNLN